MGILIREFTASDIEEAASIWNTVVADGVAFPQLDLLDEETGLDFFMQQSFTGVAYNEENNQIMGLYILHPNNIGRCGHICNASYAVAKNMRGHHIGEVLVRHCMAKALTLGFKILQFNAVVSTNSAALSLYEKLGFTRLGVIPGGFLMKDGHYEDIIPHYIVL
ncbi:MAG: GNAT family N-acetyltransferase [Clostridium sp.]|nr:GNAT family N-acetyltransferase [Clostridium sp.]